MAMVQKKRKFTPYDNKKQFKAPQYGKKKKDKGEMYKRDTYKNIVHVLRGPTPTQAFVKVRTVVSPTGFQIDAGEFNAVGSLGNYLAGEDITSKNPTGWDQWAAMFQRYTVLASKIKVCAALSYTGDVTTQVISPFIAMTVLPSTMGTSQIQAAADNGGTANLGIQGNLMNDRFATTVEFTNSGANRITTNIVPGQTNGLATQCIKKYIKTKTLFPDKDVVDDNNFEGTTSSAGAGYTAPNNQAFWYLILQRWNSNGEVIWNGYAQITQYVLFSSPVNVYEQ